MSTLNTFDTIICPVIDAMHGLLGDGACLRKDPATVLFGMEAVLDSVGLLNFITATEEQIEKVTGRSIKLVTPRAMAAQVSPFSTLGTLAAYIDELLGKGAGA
jgi:hypothetical protein